MTMLVALTTHTCFANQSEAHHLVLCQVDIDTVEKFEALRETEKQYFLDMVKQCKDSGATLIICQWHALAFNTLRVERTVRGLTAAFCRSPGPPPSGWLQSRAGC